MTTVVSNNTIPPWLDIPQGNRANLRRVNYAGRSANADKDLTLTVGTGDVVPLLYGRYIAKGKMFLLGSYQLSRIYLQVGVAWSLGEISSISAIYLNNLTKQQWIDAGYIWPGAFNPLNISTDSYSVDGIETFNGTQTQGIPFTFTRGGGNPSLFSYGDYTDDNLGIAYSCFSFDPNDFMGNQSLSSIPTITALAYGKEVYDPRTVTTAYSNNLCLHLADILDNYSEYTVDWDSIVDSGAADYCEEDVTTGMAATAMQIANHDPCVRAIGGFQLYDAVDLDSIRDSLAEQAKVILLREQGKWIFVPDKPTASITTIGVSDILANSLSFRINGGANEPTVTRATYSQIVDDLEVRKEYAETPIPGSGVVRRATIDYFAYQNMSSAYRAAVERQNKINLTNVNLSWQAFDNFLRYQRGDRITVDHPQLGSPIDVRINEVSESEIGRYSVSASKYDADVYSNDVVTEPSYPAPIARDDIPYDFNVRIKQVNFNFGFWKAKANGDIGPALMLELVSFGTPYTIDDYSVQYFIERFDSSVTEPGPELWRSEQVASNAYETEALDKALFSSYFAIFIRARLVKDGLLYGPIAPNTPATITALAYNVIGATVSFRDPAPIGATQIADVTRLSWDNPVPGATSMSYQVRYFPGGPPVNSGNFATGILIGTTTNTYIDTSALSGSVYVAYQATHTASATVLGIVQNFVNAAFTAGGATAGDTLFFDGTNYMPARISAVRKTSNTTLKNTFTNIPGLSFSAEANSYYSIEIYLQINDGFGSQSQIQFSVPAGATYVFANSNDVNRSDTTQTMPAGAAVGVLITGTIVTSGTSGTVNLQGKYLTPQLVNASFTQNSWIRVQKM